MCGDYSVGQVITVDGCDGAVEAIVLEISASGVFYDTLPVNEVYWSGADQAAALLDGWALFQLASSLLSLDRSTPPRAGFFCYPSSINTLRHIKHIYCQGFAISGMAH